MIFLRYESFREYIRFYPITSIILLINVIMFLLVVFSPLDRAQALFQYGAIHNYPGGPEAKTFITSIFLHGSFNHLLFNSFAIFVFAPPLERMLKPFKYALLYLLSGIAGNIVSEFFYSTVLGTRYLSVGASGAVYGLFGAYLFLIVFRKHALDAQSRKVIQTMLVIGVIYSILMVNINLYAHLGGLLGGFVVLGLLLKLNYNR